MNTKDKCTIAPTYYLLYKIRTIELKVLKRDDNFIYSVKCKGQFEDFGEMFQDDLCRSAPFEFKNINS